ncbi:MAG: NAD(P)-dependent oxidoreductase [Thermodesulfobacteriota bacterium]
MDVKERMKISRQQPRELPVAERVQGFAEVSCGIDEAGARLEAERCLSCKKPGCRKGCPLGNDIPGFIACLREGRVEDAYWTIRRTSCLPAVCARVCPQELQCEGACLRGKKGEPVAIGLLERYVVDWMVSHDKDLTTPCALPKGKKVAVVGSGPAGMAAAFYLAHAGYSCTIFESLPILGGMLTVGIPAYRLPRDIVAAEFAALKSCGVEVVTGVRIGQDRDLASLRAEGFDAVFVAVGAHVSRKLGIPGEELAGVVHGVDYLRRVNLGERFNLGKRVVVVGGGNVAIDVARTALRTGSDQAFILYRRGREEMPASRAEIHHLEEEGVKIEFLAAPVRIIGENGRMTGVECIRMQLGECDSSGRCRPVPVPDSHFIIEAEAIIPAISQDVDRTVTGDASLDLTRWGTVVVDPVTLQTSIPWIFAGGDSVLGPQTVAKAVLQGKEAAESVRRFLEGEDLRAGRLPEAA